MFFDDNMALSKLTDVFYASNSLNKCVIFQILCRHDSENSGQHHPVLF